MTFKRFNILVISLVLLATSAIAGFGYVTDVYGVYRSTRGRRMAPLQNERLFKYLFAYDYIPTNFDGILVGSSVTGNWETAAISGHHIYNASLTGGNATEERAIVEKVIQSKCPSLVLFSIQPYLTETVGKKTVFMEESQRWAGLGSLQVFKAYFIKWQESRGRRRREFSPNGQDDYDPAMFNRALRAKQENTGEFVVEPGALADYKAMVASARRCGAKVVAFIPPIETDFWDLRPDAYHRYFDLLRTAFEPTEPIIDMNGPDLATFRADTTNFTDGIHISSAGAQQLISYLERRLSAVGLNPRN